MTLRFLFADTSPRNDAGYRSLGFHFLSGRTFYERTEADGGKFASLAFLVCLSERARDGGVRLPQRINETGRWYLRGIKNSTAIAIEVTEPVCAANVE